jgi:hypothetical protein
VEGFSTEVVDGVVGFGSGDLDEGAGEPEEPSVLKTTMLAVPPLGTVTTQKAAPPTPEVATGLSSPPTPPLEGSMEQGRPLQPPDGHSILRPKVGVVLESGVERNSGFQAILT